MPRSVWNVVRQHGLFVLVSGIMTVVLVEGTVFALVTVPDLAGATPPPLHEFVRKVYRHFRRSIIQYEPACARYDPDLTYTLRPGGCEFSNAEFTNRFEINAMGLRDDAASLQAPEIIVLGDSQAMGWGVEQSETFAEVLEQETGRRVLNAGISSYGTVRERQMLDRLDTSALQVLFIQYCDNDVPENQTFEREGNRLPIMTRDRYGEVVAFYQHQDVYYPGKFVFRLLLKGLRLEPPEPGQEMVVVDGPEEARLFLNALVHAGSTSLDGVQVVAFDVHERLDVHRTFVDDVQRLQSDPAYPAYVRNLIAVETQDVLGPNDYYIIDTHLNRQGHRTVAERLLETAPLGS